MKNWQWDEGGFLKDNNKDDAVKTLFEEGGLIFRDSKVPIENAYQFLSVNYNDDYTYAFLGYIELNEWKDDDVIIYAAAECGESPEEYIKNHTGYAIENLIESHSIFDFDIENMSGRGHYSLSYKDFIITENKLGDWLDRLNVFKDNRSLVDLKSEIVITDIQEPTPYGDVKCFKTDDETKNYLLNKMNEKYEIQYQPSDFDHFEYFQATANPPEEAHSNVNVYEPLVSVVFNRPIEYKAISRKEFYAFDIPLSREDLDFLKGEIQNTMIINANTSRSLDDGIALFNKLNQDAKDELIDSIVYEITEFDDWAISNLEDIYGRTIVEANRVEDCTEEQLADLEDGAILLSQAVDKDNLESYLKGEDFNVITLLDFSRDLGGNTQVDIPHKVVVFTGHMKYSDMINEGKWTDNDVREFRVAKDASEMLNIVKELYEENQGLDFLMDNGAGLVAFGSLDEKNLSILKCYTENFASKDSKNKSDVER